MHRLTTLSVDGTNPQRRDKGWFDNNENLISPLTTQEQENIEAALAITGSQESPISVSDAYTAMEFYICADSAEDFFELSSASLAHLYFVKVRYPCKPIEYEDMNAAEKQTWNKSQMRRIRQFTKKKMIEALVLAVRAHYHLVWALQLTLQ